MDDKIKKLETKINDFYGKYFSSPDYNDINDELRLFKLTTSDYNNLRDQFFQLCIDENDELFEPLKEIHDLNEKNIYFQKFVKSKYYKYMIKKMLKILQFKRRHLVNSQAATKEFAEDSLGIKLPNTLLDKLFGTDTFFLGDLFYSYLVRKDHKYIDSYKLGLINTIYDIKHIKLSRTYERYGLELIILYNFVGEKFLNDEYELRNDISLENNRFDSATLEFSYIEIEASVLEESISNIPIDQLSDHELLLEELINRSRSGNIKIYIYPELGAPHKQPHFHAYYLKEDKAVYSIGDQKLLAGKMPNKIEKRILKWANADKLMKKWNDLLEGKNVDKITAEI